MRTRGGTALGVDGCLKLHVALHVASFAYAAREAAVGGVRQRNPAELQQEVPVVVAGNWGHSGNRRKQRKITSVCCARFVCDLRAFCVRLLQLLPEKKVCSKSKKV